MISVCFILKDTCLNALPMVICGNKCDLRDSGLLKGSSRCVSKEDGERLARDYGALFIETSCKTGDNVIEALIHLSR